MAGTINLSLSQQLDEYGKPLSGGLLYLIQAGTVSTPQNAFQDTSLTIPMPNPIPLDAAGRIPQFFLADGQIKVRLQDKNGVIKFTADNLLVIGPSAGGGGGGGAVDPTTVYQTGDMKVRYDTAIHSGFVRCNGKTIGSASSGASELADASAQALFGHLWLKDSTLPVAPGGRGASAAADWAANKTIVLPDGRARNLMGLADMGNVDVGLLTGVTFGKGNATTLGSYLGAARKTLAVAEIPSHYHSAGIYDPGHAHAFTYTGPTLGPGTGSSPNYFYSSTQGYSGNTNSAVTGVRVNSPNGLDTTYSTGGGSAFDIANPALLVTVYMKL